MSTIDDEPQPPAAPRVPRIPVVGLGASAGGLSALEAFFENVPADTGMAFVVVTHLHTGQPSVLNELLGRRTVMPVTVVERATVIEPNHVYLPAPGSNIAFLDGVLNPMERGESAPSLPIDYFFRSLAQDRKDRGVGIILSGTGRDGSIGVKEIKAALGMVMAQREASADYPDMPRSAIGTGAVDYVLLPEEMPAQLVAYAKDAYRIGPKTLFEDAARQPDEALQQLFVLLRNHTGHDFSQYKPSTVRRRVYRRLHVHHIDGLQKYVQFLQDQPTELDALFKELLIGVTSFFRDPEAFDALAAALPELVEDKPAGDVLRIWIVGCSTGEEAYSIAILLRELFDQIPRPPRAQIFATDIDPDAIEVARAGRYPAGIANDVSAERLERFFVPEEEDFRVSKSVREMVIFAPQNLIADPPFTKLDLICCRNLLIYLDAEVQRRVMPLMHYALIPGGLLFLGSSESLGTSTHLFESVDRKWKIYRRAEVADAQLVPAPLMGAQGGSGARGGHVTRPSAVVRSARGPEHLLLRELVPPTVLVHESGDIVHIHGRTGRFLEPSPGSQPKANVLSMARPGLELELAAAIRYAATHPGDSVRRDVRVRSNGHETLVDLRVRRVTEPEAYRGLFLVSFEGAREAGKEDADEHLDEAAAPGSARRLNELELQLGQSKEMHRTTIGELETANEELRSSNEELQSTNEELQSSNEELETSKEEMQSLNEELHTVNRELQEKVEELALTNDDMRNLLNATDIATVFLDRDLCIKRYTDSATEIIRLIPSDVGRPISDLVANLRYGHLVEDAQEVLRTLSSKEQEIPGDSGQWYLARIIPYRTTENVIEGLVLTFVDISKIKKLQKSERRLFAALESSPVTVFEQDRELRYSWLFSPAFGRPAEEVVGKTDREVLGGEDLDAMIELKRAVLDSRAHQRRTLRLTVQGRLRVYDLYVEPALDAGGEVVGVCGVATDVTDSA